MYYCIASFKINMIEFEKMYACGIGERKKGLFIRLQFPERISGSDEGGRKNGENVSGIC